MRRLFIVRKDLNMSTGKLAAQLMHCAEAYWTRQMQNAELNAETDAYQIHLSIGKDIYDNYINDKFTKTVCSAKNKKNLLKAKKMADELGLIENIDYGMIYDACLTELVPEEENGTTLTCMWFRPLPDEISHAISKKYQLYR